MSDIPTAEKASNDKVSQVAGSSAGRTVLLLLAAARAVVALLAIPLAPFLFREHFVVLVGMRPTKEVLLAAGFYTRVGDIFLPSVVAAAIPLSIGGVWLMYFIGRSHRERIREGQLPGWATRVIRPDRVEQLQKLLNRKGAKLVFIGRLAAFPSTLVATAAGSGGMKVSTFLAVDALGGGLSIAMMLGIGYVLGETYEMAGPWITGAGFVTLAVAAFLIVRWIRRGVTED